MELSYDVCIVSAFGRNRWLATDLHVNGMRVLYIDLSSRMGNWPIEDSQGPFGFVKQDQFSETQLECINSQDPYINMDNGFVVWTNKGPIELSGPMTKHHIFTGLMKDSFLHDLGRNFFSTGFSFYPKTSTDKEVSLLNSNYYVRFSTRQGIDKGIEWAKSKSVEYLRSSDLLDINIEGRNSTVNVELKGELNGVFKVGKVVWGLTSEETNYLGEKFCKKIFGGQVLEPEWSWLRYRIKIEDSLEASILPLEVLIVHDVEYPWTHENFLIIKRTSLEDQFDLWVRLPNLQRFNREYIKEKAEKVISVLSNKVNGGTFTVISYPQEYYYTYNDLGAARFPLFSDRKQYQSIKGSLHFLNPENWQSYSWQGQLENEELLSQELTSWWKELQLRKEKK